MQLNNCRLVIDAGGFIGTAALALAGLFPQARIISIEPSPENFSLLEENTRHHCAGHRVVKFKVRRPFRRSRNAALLIRENLVAGRKALAGLEDFTFYADLIYQSDDDAFDPIRHFRVIMREGLTPEGRAGATTRTKPEARSVGLRDEAQLKCVLEAVRRVRREAVESDLDACVRVLHRPADVRQVLGATALGLELST